MRRTTSRTSTAPMAFQLRRATPADGDLAGLAEGAGRVGRAEAIVAPEEDGAGVVEGVPAVVVVRRAEETASMCGSTQRSLRSSATAGFFSF